jgi:hypothetical protein
MSAKLKSAAQRVRNSDVDELSKTACSNMEVGISGDVQREVDDALRNGRVTQVHAPTSSLKEKKVDDFAGLDDLIGTNTNPNHRTGPNRAQASKPTSSALDDLDSLLDGPSSKPKTQPVSKPSPVIQQQQPAKKPTTAAAFDDLDDLLNTPTPKPQPKAQPKFDDLDDLLSGITPSNNKPAPKTQVRSDDFDDLDSLLGAKPASKPAPKAKPSNDMDDIDSLLADMQPPSKSKPTKTNDDDIDSLLADLGANKSRGAAKSSSNEIDDLLADLL